MASETAAQAAGDVEALGTADTGSVRIQTGLASLVLAGLLIGIGILIRGPADVVQQPTADSAGFVALVTSSAFTFWMSTTVASIPLRLYGFLALYAILRESAYERVGIVALVVSIVSLTLFAHVIGFSHIAWPAIGQLYQSGVTEAMQIAGFPGYSMALFGIAIVSGLITLVLYAYALWRSRRVPRGAVVLFVLHIFPLNLGGVLGYQFESLGGFVLALSAAWMVYSIRD